MRTSVMLDSLTGLRFMAAFLVFLGHSAFFVNPGGSFFDQLFSIGYLGVTIFFVLSGFILTYNYYDRLGTFELQEIKRFFIARVARIYPVHLLTFLIAVPLSYKSILSDPLTAGGKAVLNLLLLQGFVPIRSVYFSYNGVAWSLSDEMFFYTLLPAIIYVVNNYRHLFNPLIVFFTSVLVIDLLLALVFYSHPLSSWILYIFPCVRILDFLLGIILALIYLNTKSISKLNISRNWYTALEMGALLFFLVSVMYSPAINKGFSYSVYYLPSIASFIYVFAKQKGQISKFLSSKTMVILGELSFAFYMLHQPIINYITMIPILRLYPIITLMICLVVTLSTSYIVYYQYELPLRNRIRCGDWVNLKNILVSRLN